MRLTRPFGTHLQPNDPYRAQAATAARVAARLPRPPALFSGAWSRSAKTLLSLLLAVALAGSLGAAGPADSTGDVAARYTRLNHQMMCTCGCAQILGECNHMGCPNAPGMLQTLEVDLNGGMTDHAVLVDFAQQYGPTSLASPLLSRFNQAAWVVPPAVLMLGMLAALLLMRRWRDNRRTDAVRIAPATPREAEALARVRRETGDSEHTR